MIELTFIAYEHLRRLTGGDNCMVVGDLGVVENLLAFRQAGQLEQRRREGCVGGHGAQYARHSGIDVVG